MLGSATDVAEMTAVPTALAVMTPVAETDATVVLFDAHVTAPLAPGSRFTEAAAVAVSPTFSDSAVGWTVTLCTASARTVMAAAPFFVLSTVEVATTVVVPAATPVTSPAADTDAIAALFEAHVTVDAGVPVPAVVVTDD